MLKEMSIKKWWVLLMLITLAGSNVFAQQEASVGGSVHDSQGELPGATVFLTNTKFIMATDASGSFKFTKVPPGNYSLIVKMLGYAPFIKQLMIKEGNINLNVILNVNTRQLADVVVRPDREWFKNLKLFKTQFLGESNNARQCKILNAEILTLAYDKKNKTLTAQTDRLLNIENRALGYKITYLLINFVYDKKKNNIVYQGYPSFADLKGTSQEEEQWRENRAAAYQGSIQHFITSLYNNSTRNEGFLVYELKNWVPGGNGYHIYNDTLASRKRVIEDTLVNNINKNYKKLGFSQPLFVVYIKKGEEHTYQADGYSLNELYEDRRGKLGQSSIINLLASSVTIDGRGAFYRPQDLFLEGYMGWQKISNLTPFGFDPLKQ